MADGSPKILIVDDAPENLRLMQAIFENEGFDPMLADSGEAALSKVSNDQPAIVLLDVRMPAMSGIETLIELKKIAPGLPVVMITAYGEVPSAVEAMKQGAEDFLIRPIQSDRLVLTVVRALERRELQSQLDNLRHRKEREQELTRIRDAALELARLKSEFLARMSHEIRTPLNAIIGFTELLLLMDLSDAEREQVETIRSNGQMLMSVVNDILDYSKLDAGGGIVLENAAFALAELIRETVDAFAPIASGKGLTLESRIESGIPDRLRGDARRLRQVLSNLISNAIKFTPQGGVGIIVSRLESPNGKLLLRFEVQDTGIGISPEVQQRLFQPFVQADGSTSRLYGGTGLGLAIAARIVSQMGGGIGMQSEPGKGSSFHFTARFEKAAGARRTSGAISSGAADVSQRREALAPKSVKPGEKSGRRISVLVVEDNKANRTLAILQLTSLGYDVEAVENGCRAIEFLARNNPDIVLMDCEMPELDGYNATAEIRRREGPGKHTIIIAMTAHVLSASRSRCFASGMDDYLAKPVTLNALAKILNRWVGKIRSGKRVRRAPDFPPKPTTPISDGLDEAYINELRSLSPVVGTDVFQSLVDSFFSELPDQVAALKAAAAAKDLQALRKAAHALKGAASTVGAIGFAQLCRNVQESAERSEAEAACGGADHLIGQAEVLPQLLGMALKARSPQPQLTR